MSALTACCKSKRVKKSSVLGTISTIANVAWKVNGIGGEKPMSAMKFVCRMLEEADEIIK